MSADDVPGAGDAAVTVAIVDDEPLARENLRLLLRDHADVALVGEAVDAAAARALVERVRPEIVFLDVKMPGGEGFDVLDGLRVDPMPVVVFVTAYDQHALRAFGARAVDYLLKPFDDARFEAALAHARERVEERRAARSASALRARLDRPPPAPARRAEERRYVERFVVRDSGRTLFVPSRDVAWIEARGPYVRLHTTTGPRFMRAAISTVADEVDPDRFVRVHRSAIVNVDFVHALRSYSHGDYLIVLRTGMKLRLSRRRREAIERLLKPRK